jgi:hypothetical protein
VGANVTIGHRCVVHACTIMDNVRIGIGAVVLTGAVVEEWAQVGAGAVVPQGKVVPAGWLVMGVPAKPVRKMTEDELEDIRKNAVDYLNLWQRDYMGNPSGWPLRQSSAGLPAQSVSGGGSEGAVEAPSEERSLPGSAVS